LWKIQRREKIMARELLGFKETKKVKEFVEELNGGEQDYSVRRLINAQADRSIGNCLELEISNELSRRLSISPRGAFIPLGLKLAGQRTLSTTAGAGGQTVFTKPGSLIELLRNALVVGRLGVTILDNLTGPVSMPRELTGGQLTWTAEIPGSDVADSDLTTDAVTLIPKSAQSSTAYSRQLLAESSIDVEALVRADLVGVNAQGIDKAAIQGTGTLQPLGVLNQTGVGDAAVGADGGYPSYELLQNLETLIYAANAPLDRIGWLTTPGIRGFLRKLPKISTYPEYVWRPQDEALLSSPALVSNNVPSTLTKGSKSDCHAIVVGSWAQMVIGTWGVIDIIVDPFRLKKQAIVEVTSFIMVDVCLKHANSFAACKDARIVA
jgi:HK97 family phage major capsid protein